MSQKYSDHINGISKVLKAEFERLKNKKTDASVKGGSLENIVADFLRKHSAAWFVAQNCTVFDSFDKESMEQDICLCNRWQTFKIENGETLICEGVGCIVQVKTRLDSKEINQIEKNCASAKKLRCRLHPTDRYGCVLETPPEYKLPYFVIVGYSTLKPETICKKLNEHLSEDQPDKIFLIDRGFVLMNTKIYKGTIIPKEGVRQKIIGWVAHATDESTIYEFVGSVNENLESITRCVAPRGYYQKPASINLSKSYIGSIANYFRILPNKTNMTISLDDLTKLLASEYSQTVQHSPLDETYIEGCIKRFLPTRGNIENEIRQGEKITVNSNSGNQPLMDVLYIPSIHIEIITQYLNRKQIESLVSKFDSYISWDLQRDT